VGWQCCVWTVLRVDSAARGQCCAWTVLRVDSAACEQCCVCVTLNPNILLMLSREGRSHLILTVM